MTTELHRVVCKSNDYKICTKCKKLNWYENERCCESSCGHTKFDASLVLSYAEDEYEFYTEEGYTESEIDNIEIEC
jgi:hypothetical protein